MVKLKTTSELIPKSNLFANRKAYPVMLVMDTNFIPFKGNLYNLWEPYIQLVGRFYNINFANPYKKGVCTPYLEIKGKIRGPVYNHRKNKNCSVRLYQQWNKSEPDKQSFKHNIILKRGLPKANTKPQ